MNEPQTRGAGKMTYLFVAAIAAGVAYVVATGTTALPVISVGLVAVGAALVGLGVPWMLLERQRLVGVVCILAGAIVATAGWALPRVVDGVGPPRVAVRVVVGQGHACALPEYGTLQCWGWNMSGQVGNGTNEDNSRPVPVSGLNQGVASIASGNDFTCALLGNGSVVCWGENASGQLGSGMAGRELRTNYAAGGVIGLGAGVASIATGYAHACAVTSAGAVMCWGSNSQGQLGVKGPAMTVEATPIEALANEVAQVAAGVSHTCALRKGGAVECWGDLNHNGVATPTPTRVQGLPSSVTRISAGRYYTCAVTQEGDAYCWGWNPADPLLRAGTDLTPVLVSGVRGQVRNVSVGDKSACVLLLDRTVRCWGLNEHGQLGDGTTKTTATPVGVAGLSNVSDLAAGGDHACAMTADFTVYCWGNNDVGQLGNGSTVSSLTIVKAAVS